MKLFLRPLLGGYFCGFGYALTRKCSILGSPWRPAGAKMAPKIAQVAQKLHPFLKPVATFLETWNRLASKVAFGAFPGTILVDFGLILHGFWWLLHNCWCISEAFFAIIFADCQRRPTRSELAANIKNIQISAETCKIQTQAKNADTKTLIDNLQFAESSQLQQTPIVKNGGRR